jgi:hypothetical protein
VVRLGIGRAWRLAIGAAALACACGGSLPRPPLARHPTSALAKVPYPPPPARVEFVPEAPRADAVWIDGEWLWQGRQWAWKYGRWVVPPPGALFAPWTTVRDRDATLYFAAGTWRDPRGARVAEPRPLVLGRATEEDVPEDEGLIEDTGENVAPRAAR